MITYHCHTQHQESEDAGDTQAQRELAAIGRGNSEFLVRQSSEVEDKDDDDMVARIRAVSEGFDDVLAVLRELLRLAEAAEASSDAQPRVEK